MMSKRLGTFLAILFILNYTLWVLLQSVSSRPELEILSPFVPQQVKPPAIIYSTSVASWYGFESCTNDACMQANVKPMQYGDDGMACSYKFDLGDRVVIKYGDVELILVCTDRGGFEEMGREFDLHKWNFQRLASLDRGLIEVEWIKL